MGCVVPQDMRFPGEAGGCDGYTRHTIPTLYIRCFRRLRGAEVGRTSGLSGRVKQEWGSVYGTLGGINSFYLSKMSPLYASMMRSACCASEEFEYLFLKIDKDLGNCIFRGFCDYFGVYCVICTWFGIKLGRGGGIM